MFDLCVRFQPAIAIMANESSAETLSDRVREAGLTTQVQSGPNALCEIARSPESDTVMASIVGAAGLMPVLEAVRAGKRVLLANKESLVMCGSLLIEESHRHGATILPIDSEHNAIFQCLPSGFRAGERPAGVRRLLLTCSGGPFRTATVSQLQRATPEEACAHPRWSMGRKISVDSATLMNKGLELIEACCLFALPPENIQVVIHPQSIVHSMVEYSDGSVLAQMGNPDMRTPIAHALAWPHRIESGVRALDLFETAHLDFEKPDPVRFPCLTLAQESARLGGTAPAILNAANEVAVQSFLDGTISFTAIPVVIEKTLENVSSGSDESLDLVIEADRQARFFASAAVASQGGNLRRQSS